MKFRLVYDGPLRASQKDAIGSQPERLAPHKHSIRRVFHRQLKNFWSTNAFLKNAKVGVRHGSRELMMYSPNSDTKLPMAEVVASLYQENGYRFVPLVREEMSLLCSLSILFLRRDIPGSVLSAGDIDNRIKALIDALRRPRSAADLAGNETPQPDEDPFYVLLKDDKQVTRFDVETDALLNLPNNNDQSHSCVIITVEKRPYIVSMFNMSFAG